MPFALQFDQLLRISCYLQLCCVPSRAGHSSCPFLCCASGAQTRVLVSWGSLSVLCPASRSTAILSYAVCPQELITAAEASRPCSLLRALWQLYGHKYLVIGAYKVSLWFWAYRGCYRAKGAQAHLAFTLPTYVAGTPCVWLYKGSSIAAGTAGGPRVQLGAAVWHQQGVRVALVSIQYSSAACTAEGRVFLACMISLMIFVCYRYDSAKGIHLTCMMFVPTTIFGWQSTLPRAVKGCRALLQSWCCRGCLLGCYPLSIQTARIA